MHCLACNEVLNTSNTLDPREELCNNCFAEVNKMLHEFDKVDNEKKNI